MLINQTKFNKFLGITIKLSNYIYRHHFIKTLIF